MITVIFVYKTIILETSKAIFGNNDDHLANYGHVGSKMVWSQITVN